MRIVVDAGEDYPVLLIAREGDPGADSDCVREVPRELAMSYFVAREKLRMHERQIIAYLRERDELPESVARHDEFLPESGAEDG
jgi:hypothetical protein